ncbi:MAG: GDP-mannose 4,6-dehydratase, partial [Candidatus Thermoplasmatota archaeon]|nr:GDP-mannose 4,6-dehydratase [Candidatus Thermoplasmatota archaeon]
MKCLVTGGAGFIGSHLCEHLLQNNYQITCVDNLITGSLRNINHLVKHDHFTFINHDITTPLSNPKPLDEIYHFASPASPVDYYKYPIETLRVGSIGTEEMLNLALQKKARFLLASTSEVYGDPEINPQPEEYWGHVNPIGPRSIYDEAKRYAEACTMAYHRKYHINTRIARIFNTYGPRMKEDDGRAVPNFIKQALTNTPITIYGNGKQTRSFCYITDEIHGLYALMQSNYHLPVNIGNPEERTILDLATIIKEMCHSKSPFIFKDLP